MIADPESVIGKYFHLLPSTVLLENTQTMNTNSNPTHYSNPDLPNHYLKFSPNPEPKV